MEEIKQKLSEQLESMQQVLNDKQKITEEQIKNYIEYSKEFLIEYFKQQQFIDLFFYNNIYDNLINNTNIININNLTKLFNSSKNNFLKIRIINEVTSDILNSIFGISYQLLIENILDQDIYSSDIQKRNNALSFIRQSTDTKIFLESLHLNETIIKQLKLHKLNEKMHDVFLNSGRFLLNQTIQQVLNYVFGIDIFHSNNFRYIYNEKEDCYDINFVYKNQKYIIKKEKKENGVNAGFILVIYNEDDKIINKFFIKKYHKGSLYCANKHGDSKSKLETKIPSITSRSFIASPTDESTKTKTKVTSERFLDLKEPFMYKVLQLLQFGPDTHFIINPYVERGFYIVTKDIALENEYFSIMTEIMFKSFQTKQKKQDETDFSKSTTVKSQSLFVGLSELNLFGLVTSLEDLNTGNYGYVFKNKEDYEKQKSKGIDQKQFKIIDFAYPSYSETKQDKIPFNQQYQLKSSTNDILNQFHGIKFSKESFIERFKEQLTNISIMTLALSQFEERLYNLIPQFISQEQNAISYLLNSEETTLETALLSDLLQTQSKYVKDLMLTQRGETKEEKILRHPTEEIEIDGVRRLRNRTNAELIGFKNGKAPEDVEENKERLKYLDNAFEDLDTYCNGIVYNYKTLKTFIEDGYNQYFDNEGNLREVE